MTISPKDFVANKPLSGETNEVPPKMSDLIDDLQSFYNEVVAAIGNIDSINQNSADIANNSTAIQAEINNRISALASLQSSIDGITNTLTNIHTEITDLKGRADANDVNDLREINNRIADRANINESISSIQLVLNSILALGTVSISELDSTIATLNATLAQADDPFGIASVVGLEDELNNVTMSSMNIIGGHGRFLDFGGDWENSWDWWNGNDNIANFDPTALSAIGLAGYNGMNLSTPVESGRHYFDATNYSGSTTYTDGALALEFVQAITDLALHTSNLSNWRYTPAFAIAKFTAGTGTGSTVHENHYRQLNTVNSLKYGGIGSKMSFAYYCKPVGGSFKVLANYDTTFSRETYINGVKLIDGNWHEIADGEIAHVCHVVNYTKSRPHYSSTAWHWLLEAGTELHMALPVMLPVAKQIKPHVMPQRSETINAKTK